MALETCSGTAALAIDLRLDGRSIYHTISSTCTRQTESTTPWRFTFAAPRRIVWENFRNPPPVTERGTQIAGRVWQAGQEADGIVIGLRFTRSSEILMHTFFVAALTQPTSIEIERGFLLKTRSTQLHTP